MTTSSLGLGVTTALGALLTVAFLASMWRRRTEPMATPLLTLAGVLLVAVTVNYGLVAFAPVADDSWIYFVFLFSAIGLGLWIHFAFQYTGRGRRVTNVVATGITTMVVLLVVGPIVGALVLQPSVNQFISLIAPVTVFLLQALTIVSTYMLIAETTRANSLLVREALAQAGGILTLSFAPLLTSIYQAPASFPLLVGCSSACFLAAIHRYSLFETLPVARVVGRDQVINEIADPVVVVDTANTIQDINPASEEAFGLERSAVLNRPFVEVVPGRSDPETVADTEEPTRVRTADGRTFVVTADRVTDRRGRLYGYLLLYHDVTERRERERRLGVLNQLLTGAVRERIESVIGDAAALDPSQEGEDAAADRIWDTTTELMTLVSRTREVERAFTRDGEHATDAAAVISTVADGTGVQFETVPDGSPLVGISEQLLVTTLEILIDHAFEQAPDRIELGMADGRRQAVVRILGAEAARLEPRQSVDELAVELAGLAAEHAGGRVTLSDPESGRSSVRLSLPTVREDGDGIEGANRVSADGHGGAS